MIPTHTHTSLYVLAWAVVCRRVSAIHGKTKELALTHTHHEIAHVCAFPVCVSMRHKQAPECYDSSSTHTHRHTHRETHRDSDRDRERHGCICDGWCGLVWLTASLSESYN